MSLHYPGTRRERILAYGLPGAGKSSIWLCIAEWIYKTKGSEHVWVVDSDNAWDAMRPEDGHLDTVVNQFPIYDYADYKDAVKKIREGASRDDWYTFDRIDPLWDQAQEAYSRNVEGEDIDEFFLRHEIEGTLPGGDYGKRWVQIRRMYHGMGIDLVTRFPGHVLAVASAKEIHEQKGQFGDDADIYAKYEMVRMKPAGKADLPHLFHTELFMVDSPSGYRMTTLKERKPFSGDARPYMKGKVVDPDFVMAYLMGVAGWKL